MAVGAGWVLNVNILERLVDTLRKQQIGMTNKELQVQRENLSFEGEFWHYIDLIGEREFSTNLGLHLLGIMILNKTTAVVDCCMNMSKCDIHGKLKRDIILFFQSLID